MSALRALRELAAEARDNHERASCFEAYFTLESLGGARVALQYVREHARTAASATARQAYADILAALEPPSVEVER